MSYWVNLIDESGPVEVARFSDGGTYVLGGATVAELNVTYNYSRQYALCEFSLRDLDGLRAGDTITRLTGVVTLLGTERDQNYWEPTPGNAGYAASILLGWAREHPDATWEVH